MTKLTTSIVRKIIKNDERFDQNIDLDEPGKVILYLKEGWTFNALDGNRSVDAVHIDHPIWENESGGPDTIGYLKNVIKLIEPIR
jgi:hypothetical protein